jgi:hypothetical protein
MSIQIDDDDESYLVPMETNNQHANTEQAWCKIGETGELEFVDWNIVASIASEYDRTDPSKRNDKMLIAKLMWLTRQVTLKECGK